MPNDRLLLGIKGTMSEMECATLRQRAQVARRLKAERGELLTTVGVGYVRTADERVEKDPNRCVQAAIAHSASPEPSGAAERVGTMETEAGADREMQAEHVMIGMDLLGFLASPFARRAPNELRRRSFIP